MSTSVVAPVGPAGWMRLIARMIALVILLLVCLILYALAAALPGRNPMPRLFLTGVLRIVGGRLRVQGDAVLAPSVLLANHVSWIDIPALAAATGTAFVAHSGLADNRLMRTLCRLNRTVFIARNDRASVAGQVDQVRDGLRESGVLTLFPEGTTNNGRELLPFKSSLLAAVEQSSDEVAIRPVCLDYGEKTDHFAWFGDEPGLANFTRILASRGRFTITTHILPALTKSDRRDRKTISAAAQFAVMSRMDQRVAL